MTDPGLNHRLRQRSRRSGIMIGLSMLLTLAVCVASFTFIYSQLEPLVSDFVGQGGVELPTPVPTQPPATEPPAPEPTAPPAENATEPAVEPTAPPEDGGDNQAEAEPSPTSEEFTPDYQIDAVQPINLRPGPGVASGDAVVALRIGQPLQSTGEEEATTDPERDQMDPGQVWIKVRTEDGFEGWVREFDLTEYVP